MYGTKIVFFVFGVLGIFLGFFGILISDSESVSNFELEGGLNGSDPISVIKVHTGSKLLFLVFFYFKVFGDFLVTSLKYNFYIF